MDSKTLTVLLLIGLAINVPVLAWKLYSLPLPGNNIGYEPAQPIAFSHRLHAGELTIGCQYCHTGADKSRHAGLPALTVCMNCHKNVSAPWADVKAEMDDATAQGRKPRAVVSPEIRKLYAAMGCDEKGARDPSRRIEAVAWTRVYAAPDFVYFDHRFHVNSGLECQQCHGTVEAMDRVRQVPDMSMGWCIQCHRDNDGKEMQGRVLHPSTNCYSCHY